MTSDLKEELLSIRKMEEENDDTFVYKRHKTLVQQDKMNSMEV